MIAKLVKVTATGSISSQLSPAPTKPVNLSEELLTLGEYHAPPHESRIT